MSFRCAFDAKGNYLGKNLGHVTEDGIPRTPIQTKIEPVEYRCGFLKAADDRGKRRSGRSTGKGFQTVEDIGVCTQHIPTTRELFGEPEVVEFTGWTGDSLDQPIVQINEVAYKARLVTQVTE